MCMFCKSYGVKQKKQVLSVKQTKSYAQADVIALSGNSLSFSLYLSTSFSLCFSSNILKKNLKKKERKPNLRHYCLKKTPNFLDVFRQTKRPTSDNPATLSLSSLIFVFFSKSSLSIWLMIQKFTCFLGSTWPCFSSSDHIELLRMQNLHKTLMKNASNSKFQKTIEHIHCPQVSSWKFHLLTT